MITKNRILVKKERIQKYPGIIFYKNPSTVSIKRINTKKSRKLCHIETKSLKQKKLVKWLANQ